MLVKKEFTPAELDLIGNAVIFKISDINAELQWRYEDAMATKKMQREIETYKKLLKKINDE